MKARMTHYRWIGPVQRTWKFAVITDLHDAEFDHLFPLPEKVDAILIVGDLVLRYTNSVVRAREFLQEAPRHAPVYYSIGNHERKLRQPEEWLEEVRRSDAVLLDNTYLRLGPDLVLGALSSSSRAVPDPAFLGPMSQEAGVKLLMCHHPEDYPKYVQAHDIDLTLSGHAHGGQIQLFGHGLYAPGQGILPRWTDGYYDQNRLLVSRGFSNTTMVPRINNPCEWILLTMEEDHERT